MEDTNKRLSLWYYKTQDDFTRGNRASGVIFIESYLALYHLKVSGDKYPFCLAFQFLIKTLRFAAGTP